MTISFSGPSGVGKGFIKEQLLQLYPDIKELLWYTTRTLRPNEEGRNRIHISSSEFSHMAELGTLVLVQDLFGHRYGLKKEDLEVSSDIKLTELHPTNLIEALAIDPTIFAIGFVTSDFLLLHKRLTVVRKTESEAEIENRVTKAKSEIETILQHRSLYASVIEIIEAEESTVFNKVHAILQSQLNRKGER